MMNGIPLFLVIFFSIMVGVTGSMAACVFVHWFYRRPDGKQLPVRMLDEYGRYLRDAYRTENDR